jgi:hypothetical protein
VLPHRRFSVRVHAGRFIQWRGQCFSYGRSICSLMFWSPSQTIRREESPPSWGALSSPLRNQTLTEMGSSGPFGAGLGWRVLKLHSPTVFPRTRFG